MELIRISPEITRWMEDLVCERASPELALQFVPGVGWELTVVGSSRRVVLTSNPVRYERLAVTLPPHAARWDPRAEGWEAPLDEALLLPGVADIAHPVITMGPDGARITFDLFWFALWALSRGEEAANTERDTHNRFPVHASHAFQQGYLDRPLVDEWFALLREVVQRTWPALPLVHPKFSVAVSHDVDEPHFLEGIGFYAIVRRSAGDILRRHAYVRGLSAPFRWLLHRIGVPGMDPYNQFAWMMQQAEARGLRSTFHFLCGNTDARYDRSYRLSDPYLRTLLASIHARGHAIGLHPSYGSCYNAGVIQREAKELRRHCTDLGIPLPRLTNRMHYLRWATPETPRALAAAGIFSDCTLGYAELPGFRCSTCFEYSAFDPTTNNRLSLRIQPLVAMDVSLLSNRYLNLGYVAACARLTMLKRKCRAVGGCFTLCWHNSELDTPVKRRIFQSILDT